MTKPEIQNIPLTSSPSTPLFPCNIRTYSMGCNYKDIELRILAGERNSIGRQLLMEMYGPKNIRSQNIKPDPRDIKPVPRNMEQEIAQFSPVWE